MGVGFETTSPYQDGFYVFKDTTNQPPIPPRYFTVEADVNDHPYLNWQNNTEDDISRYRVYRDLTSGGPPVMDGFTLIAELNYPAHSYTDPDVLMNQYIVNCYVWYLVRAVDSTNHESGNSAVERFWALYHPQGYGPGYVESPVTDPLGFGVSATPNPFNPTTCIAYSLPEAGMTRLAVYDVNGRWVAQLVNGLEPAGIHQVSFDGSRLPSGVYLYQLTAGANTATGKMVLIK